MILYDILNLKKNPRILWFNKILIYKTLSIVIYYLLDFTVLTHFIGINYNYIFEKCSITATYFIYK